MADDNVTQQDFYDSQDSVADLEQIYTSFISDIDATRSRFITPPVVRLDLNLIQNIVVSNRVNPQNTPQESRCNAFYRLLGLPVISPDGKMYNPGYRPDLFDPRVIENRINIANSLLTSPVGKIFMQREVFPQDMLRALQKQDVHASALAYSIKFLRPVNKIFEQDDPLAAEAQVLPVANRKDAKLNYDEALGVNPKTDLPHILKPFMTDPRIDFTVFPVRNRVAVPFLSDKQRQISSGVLYKIPFIEKVARVRLNIRNNDTDVPDVQKVTEAVRENAEITDRKVIELLGGISRTYRSDIFIFNNLFKMFRVIVDELFESVKIIDKTSSHIHWVPIPSAQGLEAGISHSPFIVGDPLARDIDQELDKMNRLKIIADSEIDLLKTDLGVATNGAVTGSAFSGLDSVAFGAVLNSAPKVFDQRIADLNQTRDHYADRAAQALRNIAIIMGDLSGLGLLDMVAIYSALWTVDRETLVGMLDQDTIERMRPLKELHSAEVVARLGGSAVDVKAVGTKFQTRVNEMLNLFDALIESKRKNG